jgi:uncharacterized protein YbjT (DUF2867 family)
VSFHPLPLIPSSLSVAEERLAHRRAVTLNLSLGNYAKWKLAAENLLRASPYRYTIVAAAAAMDKLWSLMT